MQNLDNLLSVLNLPSINKQPPPPYYGKPRPPPPQQPRNRIKTIKVNPDSNGGTIQLQTGYGIKTNHDLNDVGSGMKRETVPPLPPPPQPHHHVALATERPSFYYNPKLDEIFPATPPTYTPPPTEPTIYNMPLHSGYPVETGKEISAT